MTREAILFAKREDLRKCNQTRNSLLLELYRSTAVLSNIKKRSLNASSLLDIDLDGEQAFLDANDLSKGRYFNPASLVPPSPESLQGHALPIDHDTNSSTVNQPLASTTTEVEKSPHLASATGDKHLSLPAKSLSNSGLTPPTTSDQTPPYQDGLELSRSNIKSTGTDAASIRSTAGDNESNVAEPARGFKTAKPLEIAALSADDTSTLPESTLKQLEAENKPNGARTVHLPSKERQEERLENLDSTGSNHHHQRSPEVEADGNRSSLQLPNRQSPQNSAQYREDSGPEPSTAPCLDHGAGQAESGTLESQIAIARSDAVTGGSSFTPDEQLRLEEARSLQDQLTDSHAETAPQQPSDAMLLSDTYTRLDEVEKESEPANQASNMEIKPPHSFGREQQQRDAASELSALRNHAYSGFAGNIAKDITFSQRPPMRIDTGILPESSKIPSLKKPLESNAALSHTPPDSATSAKASQASAQAQSPPERMTTRVSSGALRHKSVSEILGETPKPLTPHADKASNERAAIDTNRDAGLQSPGSSIAVMSPDPATFRLRLHELKEKDKSKLSTVVFARKQQLQPRRHLEKSESWESDNLDAKKRNTNYFLPLFNAQSASPPRAPLLNRIIGSASKTVTTANHYVDYHEQQDCRILSRIEQLQKSNRWSLRQLERSAEPERPTVHWDVVLSQMRWLRTDFREERKWKVAAASSVAKWCAEWVAGTKPERLALQVRSRLPSSVRAAAPESVLTPDLIPSAEDDSSDAAEDEVETMDIFSGKAPAAIFSMAPEMFYFGLEKTASAEKLLQELPLYQPSVDIQRAALRQNRLTLDNEWKTALLPVSRFGEGKLVSHDEGPPRKKSRYDYADLDEDGHMSSSETADHGNRTPDLPPEQADVALFNPENKHIRDRIHAGHAFRPPSEHVMPSQSFFESRHSSQWTQPEDDELRRLVREYAYNWSLISSCLSFPSAFSSGAERRTPWECFERWIGLEGLPAEMAKTQYFRAYHGRLQAAQTTHESQQQVLQQQQQQGSNIPTRRRSTQPVQVERRRNMKHVHLVNAMKNLARKREASAKKPEKAVDATAIRRAVTAVQPRHTVQTPQEFSRLRHESDLKRLEQQKIYRMQMMQQQKVHAAQRSGLQSGQHPTGNNLAQPGRNAVQAMPNGNGPTNLLPNGQAQPNISNQPRPPQMPRPSNGVQSNGSFSTNQQGIPHAPMQPAHMPGPARLPPQMGPDNLRVLQEVNRVQAEQQRFLQQQQQRQQQHLQMNNQTSPNPGNSNYMPTNASSNYTTFQRRSGSPSVNGAPTPNGSSSSPRMTNPSQPQTLSSGMMPTINQIMNQLRARNPNATQEQISQMATDRLKQYQVTHSHAHAHAAMQAAAGSSVAANAMNANALSNLQAPPQQQPPTAIMNASPLTATQQYAQMIRNQQQHQQNRNSGTPYSGQQSSSRGATPQIHRTPSAQGSQPSPSLLPSQAQVAGGQ